MGPLAQSVMRQRQSVRVDWRSPSPGC